MFSGVFLKVGGDSVFLGSYFSIAKRSKSRFRKIVGFPKTAEKNGLRFLGIRWCAKYLVVCDSWKSVPCGCGCGAGMMQQAHRLSMMMLCGQAGIDSKADVETRSMQLAAQATKGFKTTSQNSDGETAQRLNGKSKQ